MMSALAITIVGLMAQVFFSARTLVQWIMSERARKVLSPSLFWIFSVCGSILLGVYGWLRMDFAVMLGQFFSYYVYMWNLKAKKIQMPGALYWFLMLLPVVAAGGVVSDWHGFIADFFQRPDVPLWMVAFGVTGQVLFTLRFLYQWWFSSRIGKSELPPLFWWISLTGAVLILTYGFMRLDVVLILGQGFGIIVYVRNLMIGWKASHSPKSDEFPNK